MLKHIIDGKIVEMSPQQEENLRKWWALNDAHPEYQGHIGFDRVHPPVVDMENCIHLHENLMVKAIRCELKKIRNDIEYAEETNDPSKIPELIEARKRVKNYLHCEYHDCVNIEQLKQKIPDELKKYWKGLI